MDQEELFTELVKRILEELPKILGPKRLFTIDEAGVYMGVAPKTIRNGLGPKAKNPFPVKPVRIGGRVLFKKEDLDAYVDSLE